MTPAERNRRNRRLRKAGYKALPEGWVLAEFADRAKAQVIAHRADVEKAEAVDLPRGRPRKAVDAI